MTATTTAPRSSATTPGAGSERGVIGHTYSSASVLELRVHGRPHNEAGINAIRLGHHGVPVILVAGDDALAAEIAELLPWAERVVVKRALGSTRPTRCRRPSRRARSGMGWFGPSDGWARWSVYEPALPLLARSTSACRRWPTTRRRARHERVGPRTVGFEAPDGDAFYRTCLALTRLAAVPAA